MNMQFNNYNKKYTVKPTRKKAVSEERPRAEFAEMFVRSYDNALKRIMHGEKGKDAMDFIKELKEETEED